MAIPDVKVQVPSRLTLPVERALDAFGAPAQRRSTSIVVTAELRCGAAKRGSARLSRQVEAILDALPIIPLEEPADAIYAHARLALERVGQPIGGNDWTDTVATCADGALLLQVEPHRGRRQRTARYAAPHRHGSVLCDIMIASKAPRPPRQG